MKIFSVFLFCLLSQIAFGQHSVYSFQEDYSFAQYLNGQKEYESCIQVLKSQDLKLLMMNQRDSLNHSIGQNYYHLQQLDLSSRHFSMISNRSPFFIESRFFSALDQINLKHYDQAKEFLLFKTHDPLEMELVNFELSSVALLERAYGRFDSLSNYFTKDYYQFSKEEENLKLYHQKLLKIQNRSPFVGGLLSAIVPGLGKVYAGKWKQGLVSFFSVTIIGLQAAEGFWKGGYDDWRFIAFGGLTTIFYIGNIWGSVLSVKISKHEKFNSIDNQILFDLHIPLRTVFNTD